MCVSLFLSLSLYSTIKLYFTFLIFTVTIHSFWDCDGLGYLNTCETKLFPLLQYTVCCIPWHRIMPGIAQPQFSLDSL